MLKSNSFHALLKWFYTPSPNFELWPPCPYEINLFWYSSSQEKNHWNSPFVFKCQTILISTCNYNCLKPAECDMSHANWIYRSGRYIKPYTEYNWRTKYYVGHVEKKQGLGGSSSTQMGAYELANCIWATCHELLELQTTNHSAKLDPPLISAATRHPSVHFSRLPHFLVFNLRFCPRYFCG